MQTELSYNIKLKKNYTNRSKIISSIKSSFGKIVHNIKHKKKKWLKSAGIIKMFFVLCFISTYKVNYFTLFCTFYS